MVDPSASIPPIYRSTQPMKMLTSYRQCLITLPRMVRSGLVRLVRDGPRKAVGHAIYRVTEQWYERRLNIDSTAVIELSEFGLHDHRLLECRPTDYRTIRRAFRALPIRPAIDVLLDVGAGTGRVLVMAGTFPFRRIIGVELVPQLADKARENVRQAGPRLRCKDITVFTADATTFEISPEITVFYFYNSFWGEFLERTFENIRTSLRTSPRQHIIVSVRPASAEEGWIGQQPWLRRTRVIRDLRDANVFFYEATG